MSKRFTATDKWDRPWFRKLPPTYKCFWLYLTDKCDLIGVWYVDFEMAEFVIGQKLDPSEALRLFEKQIEVLDPKRWFIPDFVAFQYGELTENNNLHRSVATKLRNLRPCPAPQIPLNSPSSGAKVLVLDKVKEDSVSSSGDRGVGKGVEIPADLQANESEIRDWLQYKQERREGYKPTGLKGLWVRIRAIPADRRKETILHSIGNGWKGIYENNNGGKNGKSGYQQTDGGGAESNRADNGKSDFEGIGTVIEVP